jgi:ABC-type transport system substrate-binding protein
VRSILTRHASYHLPDQPHFEALELTAVRDVGSLQLALVSPQFDAISSVDLRTVDRLRQLEDIQVDEVPSGAHCTIPTFCDIPPFDLLDVRLALKYAVDHEAIVRKILRGHGTVGNDHPIGPAMPFHADLPQRSYDPDRARYHLRKASEARLRISLSSSDFIFPGAVDLAVLFRESAAKSGITIDVKREPADGYWSNVWLKKPFAVVKWSARPTPDVIFSLCYEDDAPWNESRSKDPHFNQLLRAAKAELDRSKRAEMYREMQQLCRDDGGTIVAPCTTSRRPLTRGAERRHIYQQGVGISFYPWTSRTSRSSVGDGSMLRPFSKTFHAISYLEAPPCSTKTSPPRWAVPRSSPRLALATEEQRDEALGLIPHSRYAKSTGGSNSAPYTKATWRIGCAAGSTSRGSAPPP